ncbi:tyrosinase-like protein 2 [Mya arenaria]|uniref:tyrosinase-like protein 2 n=1 Tax=Mya arenaria TaxID=6604 RepID=UPI0022E08B2B|nr:tyrosinase-like protein 2 [Mya arenaria]
MECLQAAFWLLFTGTMVVSQSTRTDVYSEMPAEVQQCVAQLTNGTNDGAKVSEEAHIQCMQQFVWKADRKRWDGAVNMTDKETEFINDIIRSVFKRGPGSSRSKREVGPGIFPPTGFRIRKEYRRLTDFERMAVHDAFNGIKKNGGYTAFAKLHVIVIASAHKGPNFLGWHRVYLAMLEESLRRINPMVSLPYWDSTLDKNMANPEMTIIFTPPFLGNGDGYVVTGPFRHWPTVTGPLARNIGANSVLYSKEFIARMMTRCRTAEITFPTAAEAFDIEHAHGGPHNWVSGQMSSLATAAEDPVFFMHHAFVDYLWENFRIHQMFECGVNPATDYPPAVGLHHPLRPMDGFPGHRSIDGYASYWTQFWYRYERSPFCSGAMPFCGSPYLWCDVKRGRCVSAARMAPFSDGMGSPLSSAGYAASPAAANARAIAARAAGTGPRFSAPPAEPRTQAGRLGVARVRRDAPNDQTHNGTYDRYDVAISSERNGHLFTHAEPFPLLPVPYIGTVQTRKQLSSSKGTTDNVAKQTESDWFYVPIRVMNKINIERTSGNLRCHRGKQIKVIAQGLNYLESFVDYPGITAKSPISTTVAILAVRVPQIGPSEAMITAVHSCGYSCKPSCLKIDGGPAEYQPCNGILVIKPGELDLFSRSYQGAVKKMDGLVSDKQNNVRMVFHCDEAIKSRNAWSSHSSN